MRAATQVLDRLVGRAVLAEADRVVRPDVGHRQLHQRREPDRAAHVVGEGQERATEDASAAVDGDAVHDRAHAVLADAEVEHPPARVGLPHLRSRGGRAGTRGRPRSWCCWTPRGRRSRPTAPAAPRRSLEERRRRPCGWHALRVGREAGRSSAQPSGSWRSFMRCEERLPLGVLLGPGHVLLVPRPRARPRRGRATLRVCSSTSTSKVKVRRVEAEDLLGRRDLVGAERRAVGRAGVLLGGARARR